MEKTSIFSKEKQAENVWLVVQWPEVSWTLGTGCRHFGLPWDGSDGIPHLPVSDPLGPDHRHEGPLGALGGPTPPGACRKGRRIIWIQVRYIKRFALVFLFILICIFHDFNENVAAPTPCILTWLLGSLHFLNLFQRRSLGLTSSSRWWVGPAQGPSWSSTSSSECPSP